MLGLGAPELLIVLAVVVLLFGSTRLPKLARSLGEAHKEIRAVTNYETVEPAPVTAAPAAAVESSSVTMRIDDLEALLAQREARARDEARHPFNAA